MPVCACVNRCVRHLTSVSNHTQQVRAQRSERERSERERDERERSERERSERERSEKKIIHILYIQRGKVLKRRGTFSAVNKSSHLAISQ